MSESPAERRERLVEAIAALPSEELSGRWTKVAEAILDGLLDALEPPVADMVRYGASTYIIVDKDATAHGEWYRPRTPAPKPSVTNFCDRVGYDGAQ